MENGANVPLINLGPALDSAKKKQKEHKKETPKKKSNNDTKEEKDKDSKEDMDEIKDNTDSNFDNDIIEVKVLKEDNDEEEKDDKQSLRKSPNKNDSIHENKKAKRHRRTKEEIHDKQYQCPDCEKCYLSGPALTMHRKTKHGLESNNDKKIRGRPRKDNIPENPTIVSQNKYNVFFTNETRKPLSLDQTVNDKLITLEIIQKFLSDALRHYQSEINTNYTNIETYPLYKIVIDNWDKENPDIEQESYLDDYKNKKNQKPEDLKKIKSPCIDGLFYLYLKEFSKKTNKDYFWFMVKFIILFRESINIQKKNMVIKEIIAEEKNEFTQLYNAEEIPELCNDFCLDFMEPHQFFGLNKDELIELIQHFCFWLYTNQYSMSHLTLLKY